ncbi:HTH-type transcriptional repressor YcnK [Pullulanibacillus camelliae]|uniref:HTH-type transcriptional repressor YcnK n=1 Tax=Pullulanibacillus camelliae TaxID=1707096 RepID=A0A8J2YLG5_9BACL|nr:DeoR family transcriptional regulator [Pullulanibacillus camelliae]GGE50084.1 HTH-type transcriptional repressor YcnK [Pullulanibacillus camelliae]
MLPIERQRQIKALIQSKHHIKISELSRQFQVSEMTIHRDIKPLIEEGFIIKTFGGITLATNPSEESVSTSCVYCSRPIKERLTYRLILDNNTTEIACCAHCGLLRHQQLGDKVVQAICFDFLHHTTISVSAAWYVMDTSLNIGCCQPQVLTFAERKHAEQFVTGFGGQVYTFHRATEKLSTTMECCGNVE